jgi:hypothetical protein
LITDNPHTEYAGYREAANKKEVMEDDAIILLIVGTDSLYYKVDGNLMVKGTREGPLVICDQR